MPGQAQSHNSAAAPAQLADQKARQLEIAPGQQTHQPDAQRIEGIENDPFGILARRHIAVLCNEQIMRAVARLGESLPEMSQKGPKAAALVQSEPGKKQHRPLHRQHRNKSSGIIPPGKPGWTEQRLLPPEHPPVRQRHRHPAQQRQAAQRQNQYKGDHPAAAQPANHLRHCILLAARFYAFSMYTAP